jgi:hypothetical protein
VAQGHTHLVFGDIDFVFETLAWEASPEVDRA